MPNNNFFSSSNPPFSQDAEYESIRSLNQPHHASGLGDAPSNNNSANSSDAFFYSIKNSDVTVELSSGDELQVVDKICNRFEQLNRDKAPMLDKWTETESRVRQATSRSAADKNSATVPYAKQALQTLLSHFWSRSLQTDDVLFSVTGQDSQSEEMAPIHKQNILQWLRKDNFSTKLDDAVSDALLKGVCVAHVGYREETRTERRQFEASLQDYLNDGILYHEEDVEVPVYSGPSFQRIDPREFVFDTSAQSDASEAHWNSCFKAYRTWWQYEDLLDDPNFKNIEGLDKLVKTSLKNNNKNFPISTKNSKRKSIKGIDHDGRIEVLEFHGDFRMPNGDYLRNYTIVIAARTRLIRFEPNPYRINPFQKWQYERTEDGWGISPLEYVMPLIDSASTLLNAGVEAARLAINPPMLAPKGMLPQKKLYLSEGRIIEYNIDATLPNITPVPVPLNYETPFPFLQLFESQTQATTGATRQLSGNVTSNSSAQTATEFQGLQIVGNIIIDRLIDQFNHNFKLPIIEKMALIARMFNPVQRPVAIQNNYGQREFVDVHEGVYYGNYNYVIEDNKSALQRKQHVMEKIQLLAQALQNPEVAQRIKIIDVLTEMFRDLNYEGAGGWFMNDEEYTMKLLKNNAINVKVQSMAENYQEDHAYQQAFNTIRQNMMTQSSEQ